MQTAYKDLDLQLLPDRIIQELSQKSDLVSQVRNWNQSFSTELLSNQSLLPTDGMIHSFRIILDSLF
jgi:hypothetical protein